MATTVWQTPGTESVNVDGLEFPKFPRPDGPRETDHGCEVMSSVHGHFHCIWDPNIATEVEDAKTAFDRAIAQGRRPFHVGPDGKETTPMTAFDPAVGKMIILARVAGG